MSENLTCNFCKKNFNRTSNTLHKKRNKNHFCSKECSNNFQKIPIEILCSWCSKSVMKKPIDLKKSKSKKLFCSLSCSASFNNTIKRKSRRSKCEIMLCDLLVEEFPKLDIIPNDKTLLKDLESDIAIPSLKLAIEWNGIIHYKPIYGEAKLQKIQTIDQKKLLIATDTSVNLIVIPDLVSQKKYVIEVFHKIKSIIYQLQSYPNQSSPT